MLRGIWDSNSGKEVLMFPKYFRPGWSLMLRLVHQISQLREQHPWQSKNTGWSQTPLRSRNKGKTLWDKKLGFFHRREADPVGEMYKPGGDPLWFCSSRLDITHPAWNIPTPPTAAAFHHLLSCHRTAQHRAALPLSTALDKPSAQSWQATAWN